MEIAEGDGEGKTTAQESTSCPSSSSSSEDIPTPMEDNPEMAVVKSLNKAQARWEVLTPLTNEQCLLATPWVTGLDLKSKEWGKLPISRAQKDFDWLTPSTARFCIDNLSPIVWNDAAFTNLVLPGKEKELAWAFVENKALASNNFDDFIQDKGTSSVVCITTYSSLM